MSLAINGETDFRDITAVGSVVETPRVDKILLPFDNMWRTTADLCLQRALELEAAAADMRMRADKLIAARELVDEVKGAVQFEIIARQRAQSLALVNPTDEN